MRKYVAEFIVAFFLVFAGAGAIVADHYLQAIRITESFGFLGIALAHGLALAVAIAAVGRISGGHGNPAVSLAAWVSRRLSGSDLIGYIVAQLAGGALAALLLKGLMPAASVAETSVGVPGLAEGIDVFPGVAIEIILTFFLVLTIWGTAIDRKGNNTIAPLAIGLVLVFDILAGGPFTGAAMNPARWFGPALLSGQWTNAVVWIAGPIVGALLASLVYENVFLTDQPPDEEDLEINGDGEDEDEDLVLEAELFEAEKEPEVVEPPTPERVQPPQRPTVDVDPPRESPPLSPPSPPQPERPPTSPPGDRVWGSPRDDEDRPGTP